MIKLTEESIKKLAHAHFGFWGGEHSEFARAVEAEVLRLNGITDAPKEKAKFCFYCGKDTHNDSECWSTRPADWRPRTHVNTGTIGHMGHGATTLTAAISQLLASKAASLNGIGAAEYARQSREIPERAAAMDGAREQLGLPPRATGCPDTMDDTGRFAEVDMPAFLRKQAG